MARVNRQKVYADILAKLAGMTDGTRLASILRGLSSDELELVLLAGVDGGITRLQVIARDQDRFIKAAEVVCNKISEGAKAICGEVQKTFPHIEAAAKAVEKGAKIAGTEVTKRAKEFDKEMQDKADDYNSRGWFRRFFSLP